MPTLEFKGKSAVQTHHHVVPHHALEPDRKLSVLDKGQEPSLDGNIIIEGDNLLALKALLPTHAGRIKCIYIDPPYNTGNEGWVYNDKLAQPQFKEWIGQVVGKEEEDACRHDKWCCMMYPRLLLLKEILREDGAIFISIDDNEAPNLRLLLDEIFGQNNFVACIIWQKKFAPQSDAKYFSETHDYIAVYAKNREIWNPHLFARTEKQDSRYTNPDNDKRGPWSPDNLVVKTYAAAYDFPITTPSGRVVNPPTGFCWRVSSSRFAELVAENRISFGTTGNNVPRLKRFLSEVQAGLVPMTLWLRDIAGDTQEAVREVKEILSDTGEKFDSPKPHRLILRVLQIASEEGDLVLDSFAGSGTTGQAVLQLNKEDGGNRNFILIQQPYDKKKDETEKFNICEKITAERVRRVIKGYPFEGTKSEILLDEKIGLNSLKKADDLNDRIEAAKEKGRQKYDEVKAECKDGVVRVLGIKKVKDKAEGLGGSFSYFRLAPKPLFGEYRDLGEKFPPYNDLAKYIFYTETSHALNLTAINPKTGRIGEHAGESYYLLYYPDPKKDWALDMDFLKTTALKDPNKRMVVYCEKIWLHREQLREWEKANGKSLRPMVVPFNLK